MPDPINRPTLGHAPEQLFFARAKRQSYVTYHSAAAISRLTERITVTTRARREVTAKMAPHAYPDGGLELGGDHPEAVVLDLVNPVGVRRDDRPAGWDARCVG
jgi:hypothetical protein